LAQDADATAPGDAVAAQQRGKSIRPLGQLRVREPQLAGLERDAIGRVADMPLEEPDQRHAGSGADRIGHGYSVTIDVQLTQEASPSTIGCKCIPPANRMKVRPSDA